MVPFLCITCPRLTDTACSVTAVGSGLPAAGSPFKVVFSVNRRPCPSGLAASMSSSQVWTVPYGIKLGTAAAG
jgi:hypothetical protein